MFVLASASPSERCPALSRSDSLCILISSLLRLLAAASRPTCVIASGSACRSSIRMSLTGQCGLRRLPSASDFQAWIALQSSNVHTRNSAMLFCSANARSSAAQASGSSWRGRQISNFSNERCYPTASQNGTLDPTEWSLLRALDFRTSKFSKDFDRAITLPTLSESSLPISSR